METSEGDSAILKDYLRNIAKYPLLTAEEEVILSKQMKAGCELSRKRLINSNLRLVVSIAKKFMQRGLPLPDLIQEGNLGLMTGIDRFDHTRGYKVSTYVTWWIRQFIQRGIQNKSCNIRKPVHFWDLQNTIKKMIKEFDLKFQRLPTVEEIQLVVKRPENTIRVAFDTIINNKQYTMSLNTEISESGDELMNVIPSEMNDCFSEASHKILKHYIKILLGELDDKVKQIMILRYGLDGEKPRTLEEIGKMFGVTRERVRQIEIRALKTLKNSDNIDKVFIPV